jgi:hypothetical protein
VRTGRSSGARFPDVAVSASSTARPIRDVDAQRRTAKDVEAYGTLNGVRRRRWQRERKRIKAVS